MSVYYFDESLRESNNSSIFKWKQYNKGFSVRIKFKNFNEGSNKLFNAFSVSYQY